MILSAVLCPHPPLLFRELTGSVDPCPELRDACGRALRGVLAETPDVVVVVGGAEASKPWDGDPDVRRFGTTGPRPRRPSLPLSLGVGRRLLDEAGWTGRTELVTLAWDAPDADLDALVSALRGRPERMVLLLLGDGSARRGVKAPGYLDERAFPFDAATAEALRGGDASALRAIDTELATELMVQGTTAFRALGAVGTPGVAEAGLVYDDDPFGVAYHVAVWRLTD